MTKRKKSPSPLTKEDLMLLQQLGYAPKSDDASTNSKGSDGSQQQPTLELENDADAQDATLLIEPPGETDDDPDLAEASSPTPLAPASEETGTAHKKVNRIMINRILQALDTDEAKAA